MSQVEWPDVPEDYEVKTVGPFRLILGDEMYEVPEDVSLSDFLKEIGYDRPTSDQGQAV